VVISEPAIEPFPIRTRTTQIPSRLDVSVISDVATEDVPDDWGAYEQQFPEYFEPILETRPGRVADPYPGSEAWDARSSAGAGYPEQVPAANMPAGNVDYDEDIVWDSAESGGDMAAWDWGAAASGVIDILQGQSVGGGGTGYVPPANFGMSPPASGGGAVPRKVTVDTVTGAISKCGRRRRRRLLTPTDINDLAALKAIVGGGQSMNLAVAKAVRR